jgi:hypothetical protein
MSDAFHYFRAHAVRALCKARSMPLGRIRHLQAVAGRIYHLLMKEAAYGPNHHHMNDFRAAQKLEQSLDPDDRLPEASPLPRQRGGAVRKEAI